MGLIDFKILYLADVLEDIQNTLKEDCRCHRSYAESISGVVKELRDTITGTHASNEMDFENMEVVRLEKTVKADMVVPIIDRDEYETHLRHSLEDDILAHIKSNRLIRVRRFEDDENVPTFTASLIVGIEKQPYVPPEPILTPVDSLFKRMDEDCKIESRL